MKLAIFITILVGIAIVIFSMDGGMTDQQGKANQPGASQSSSVLERGLSNN